jgi:hypothetical protein
MFTALLGSLQSEGRGAAAHAAATNSLLALGSMIAEYVNSGSCRPLIKYNRVLVRDATW